MGVFMFRNPEIAVAALVFVSVGYLVLCLLVLRLGRLLEMKLIALGILTGIAAVWCGEAAVGEAMRVSGRGGPPDVSFSVGSGAAWVLGRIAILLTLGGLAVILLNRWNQPAIREEANRADRA